MWPVLQITVTPFHPSFGAGKNTTMTQNTHCNMSAIIGQLFGSTPIASVHFAMQVHTWIWLMEGLSLGFGKGWKVYWMESLKKQRKMVHSNGEDMHCGKWMQTTQKMILIISSPYCHHYSAVQTIGIIEWKYWMDYKMDYKGISIPISHPSQPTKPILWWMKWLWHCHCRPGWIIFCY